MSLPKFQGQHRAPRNNDCISQRMRTPDYLFFYKVGIVTQGCVTTFLNKYLKKALSLYAYYSCLKKMPYFYAFEEEKKSQCLRIVDEEYKKTWSQVLRDVKRQRHISRSEIKEANIYQQALLVTIERARDTISDCQNCVSLSFAYAKPQCRHHTHPKRGLGQAHAQKCQLEWRNALQLTVLPITPDYIFFW